MIGEINTETKVSAESVPATGKRFDVVVIGGGPRGYIAAVRAAQLGFSVACIKKEDFGGACQVFSAPGTSADDLKIDAAAVIRRKEGIVKQLAQGAPGLFKKHGIVLLKGHGAFVGRNGEFWQLSAGSEMVEATHVIIATGSRPRHLPDFPIDNITICDNIGALAFVETPKRLGIIGSDIIGLELGSLWSRLGAEVTVLESGKNSLAAVDESVAEEVWKIISEQEMAIRFGTKVKSVVPSGVGVRIEYTKDGLDHILEVDRLIVSVGRIANTEGLNAEAIGLRLDEQGRVKVDAACRTHRKHVWAIGDVVCGPMLAHKSMEEGVIVAEAIAGQAGLVNMEAIPSVIYTCPEIAWIGKTERQLQVAGVDYKAGKISFLANRDALSPGGTTGFVKIFADGRTGRILGMHVIGDNATKLITEGVMAIEFGATYEDIERICHTHSTRSESAWLS